MMTKIKLWIIGMLLCSVCHPAEAQKLFTLEDLNFGGKNYHSLRPQNLFLTWWGEKLMYQDAEESGLYDAKTGKKTPLFRVSDLGEGWHSAMNARYPYPGETLVLLNNGKQRVLYDWKKKCVSWKQDCANEQEAHWNKKSRAVAYVRDNQLWVTDAKGESHQLTTDGSREIVYGQAVHRNEFGIMEGIFWDNSGEAFAFYRMDQSMVTDYPQVNVFARSAGYEPDKYPMAGMTSHQVTVGICHLATRSVTYLKAGDPTDRYFTNITWSPDNKTIYLFELNRKQNDCRLVGYDAETGEKKAELYRETSDKYVEPLHPIVFLPWNSNEFILQSQKDGFNHLYIYNVKGELVRQLTHGEHVVMELYGFNTKKKSVVVATNEESPIQRNLFAIDVATGQCRTLDNGRGVHDAILSPSGEQLIDRYSEPDVPRCIRLTNTANGKSQHLLTAPDPWKEKGFQVPQFELGTLKSADGRYDLYYRMVKPADFDPTKKYPTIVYVYGGPHAHNVEASWHYYSRSWETYMAQKGYIVFILDNRGSENRGRDFEQATFHRLGQEEMKDQIKGVDYLRSLPYVDSSRLGVHGWSYGGYMTISLMTNYPDVFKVGVAGGPVIDWSLYEVMYGERYMGTPEDNKEGYELTSLLKQAPHLKGKLQIIIGYNDPTVVPQHALQFLNACSEAGTQPDFFAYPGEGHNMMGHKSVHLHERITQYFEDYLK